MKKALITMAIVVTSFASFGQGYFLFTGNPRITLDGFTTGNPPFLPAATVDVGFLWGSSSATPLVDSIFASTSTNNAVSLTANQLSTAWTDILTDPNFTLAVNSGTSATVVQNTLANGSWQYNGSSTFGVNGTSASTYHLFVIGWSNAYATPQAAALAGSAVGWSSVVSYTAVSSIGTPGTLAAAGLTQFAVLTSSVPEPTTMALAGLGGLALLVIRRRK